MPKPIADDFDFIRARMAEIASPEPVAEYPVCRACEGGGWVQVHSNRPPAFDVCPLCYNPDDLPSP
jgi:hypothetical protein